MTTDDVRKQDLIRDVLHHLNFMGVDPTPYVPLSYQTLVQLQRILPSTVGSHPDFTQAWEMVHKLLVLFKTTL